MSNQTSGGPANVDNRRERDECGLIESFKGLKLSKTPSLDKDSQDSGYYSSTSTADHDRRPQIQPRKPSHVSFTQELGLCVSNTSMEAGTKRRFLEVQLGVEKMLLEFMRKLKSVPGRQKPIAIRPMMLGKTEADCDAKPYMVVICPENIKRKVQEFFNDPLIKSLFEPWDEDTPSIEALYDAMNCFLDGTTTFCGMPIRLCDEFGHSKNATFGGIVKITSADGKHQLYGLTAGHIMRDYLDLIDENYPSPIISSGSDPVGLDVSEEVRGPSQDQTSTASTVLNNIIDFDHLGELSFDNDHNLGKVLDLSERSFLVNEDKNQVKPYLDWAVFELNDYRPNQLPFHGRQHWRGGLQLRLPTTNSFENERRVIILCASQGVKNGVLSTTPARVLIEPGNSFTDAYTVSLEGSDISDGDSGSWVVDELRLEVYGHVVADDVFGDAYVIPMNNTLADIQRCFGAVSVDFPTEVDINSAAPLQQGLFAATNFLDRPHVEVAASRPGDVSHHSDVSETSLQLSEALISSRSLELSDLYTDRPHARDQPSSRLGRFEALRPLRSLVTRKQMTRPWHTAQVNSKAPVNIPLQHIRELPGYNSLAKSSLQNLDADVRLGL